ncbi:MAG: hypothetical protein U5J99_11365 [Parvularculaceae bacterium]|nr:hypothetical protein [Parvularculaceae bacterium]
MPDLLCRKALVDTPPPSQVLFRQGINHPDLWLWDAWTVEAGDTLTLFTLALSRQNAKGDLITPADRNKYPFHVRRFRSLDGGASWRDQGAFLSPSPAAGEVMAHNIWSGSAILSGTRLLFGFTGVRKPAPGRSFLQTICLLPVAEESAAPKPSDTIVISDPEADYQEIVDAGYYLGPKETLGDDRGEEGGPILAWRDPFLFARADGSIDAFWAAKTSATAPAVAHARLTRQDDGFDCKLLAPITLPDGDDFTQAEVPKVYRDPGGSGYLLLLSTCNRLREDQPDEEVSKDMRLYRSAKPEGPWRPYRGDDSIIPGISHLFGGAFSSFVRGANTATLIAPYTEMSAAEKQLTFAPPVTIDLRNRVNAIRRAAI